MAYVSVPKDLNEVKTKFVFNLTKRQLFCFTLGALVGVPMFFLLKDIHLTLATLMMVAVMLPFFMLAMYQKHGQPLEVILKQVYEVKFVKPKIRPYQVQNFYALLENQYDYEKEVYALVYKKKAKK
ncbi:MAG: PrgI family protein [Brevinema sp.]